jgi:taurine dioxygenase
MLYALEVPAYGGDTLFASNYLAYDGLSEPMKAFLADKIAIHDVLQYGLNSGHHSTATTRSLEVLMKMRQSFPQTEHPLVCKQPETGRTMLRMLKEHSTKNVYCCRFRYRKGSLMLWDNRAVQHSPNSDYTGQRLMLRLALHSDWQPGQ